MGYLEFVDCSPPKSARIPLARFLGALVKKKGCDRCFQVLNLKNSDSDSHFHPLEKNRGKGWAGTSSMGATMDYGPGGLFDRLPAWTLMGGDCCIHNLFQLLLSLFLPAHFRSLLHKRKMATTAESEFIRLIH